MFRILPIFAALILACSAGWTAERYAFLVGVRQYDRTQLNPLQFTENDVTRLAAVLVQGGYSKSNIVLMTQTVGANETRFLPVAKNIRKELDLLLREVREPDSLLVAFSGHGIQFEEGGDSFFCPADADLTDRASLIALGDVYKSLETSKAAAKVLLVDACRNDPLSSLARSRRVIDLDTLSRPPLREPPGGVAALFSCSRGEQSFEHPDLKHGIFFHYIIQGLSGQADLDKDQEISLAELEQYSIKEVQRYARQSLATAQTPERRGQVRGLLTLATAGRSLPAAPLLEERRPGEVIENSLGMKLTVIPAGEFLQGSSPAEMDHVRRIDAKFKQQYADAELPQHRVKLSKPFLLGAHEVTKGQFARFVQEQNYRTDAERDGQGGMGYNQQGVAEGPKPQYSWRNTGFPYNDDHPVVNVSYNDAVAFCKWLTAKEGRNYCLPTEAQWEYACRGGTQKLFYHGNDLEGLALAANVSGSSAKPRFTASVGYYQANDFGLFDMLGNASEWCADCYVKGYGTSAPLTDPIGPTQGSLRVVRGGSFAMSPGFCRCASRLGRGETGRDCVLGFRVAVQ